MSGMTRSTPRSSDSGNIMPASMTMISSPSRSAIMFIPNSPRPPRGMAVRDCEVLLNEASTPRRKRESYHREVTGDSSLVTREKYPKKLRNLSCEPSGDQADQQPSPESVREFNPDTSDLDQAKQ